MEPGYGDLAPGTFASVIEDKTVELGFHYFGKERMTIEGRELAVDHYRMVGEEERDIWYDADGPGGAGHVPA